MTDEVQRLIMEVKGQQEMERLTAELNKEKEFLDQLLVIQKQGVVGVNPATIEASAAKMVGFNAQIKDTQKLLDSLKGLGGAGGRGIMGASYAFQDFTSQIQNGLGPALNSIQNNIPQMLAGLGMSGGLAGVISMVAVGAGMAMPYLVKFGETLVQWGQSIPPTLDRLKALAEHLDKNHEAIKKLKEQTTLGYFELQKYKEMVAETEKLEAEAATAKEARAFRGTTKAQRERGAAVKEAISESGQSSEDIVNQLVRAGVPMKDAERVVSEALAGHGNPIEQISRALPAFGKAYGKVSPEHKAAQAEEEADTKRNAAAQERFEKREEELKKQEEEGFENARHVQEAQEEKAAKDAKARAMLKPVGHGKVDEQIRKRLAGRASGAIQSDLAESGIDVSAEQAQEIYAGKQAELAQIQAQALGRIIHNTKQTERQIAMWRQAKQEFDQRTQQNN